MKSLSIAILTQIESPTISANLKPALEARGHKVFVYDISSVFLHTFTDNALVESLLQNDVVYYRTGLSPDVAACLEVYLKANDISCVNLSFCQHPFMAAKTYQVLTAAAAGVLTPKTLHDRTSTFEKIAGKIGSPFVAKANRSSQGKDVHLIKNQTDLDAIAPDLKLLEYFFQEYIPHNSEYRVHVVGDKAPAMYQRIPASGDFRSNVSRGGSMVAVEEDHREVLAREAISIAALFGFAITAVDFMKHSETGEFYFTEINLNPGWETSDRDATGVDLSEVVTDFLTQSAV